MHSHIFSFDECGHRTNKQFFTHFSKKKNPKIIIDYFKGLLMTHHLDIFMSGKNLGLNGLMYFEWKGHFI